MNLLTTDVVEQVCLLMKKDYHALGFLPRAAVEYHWGAGELILQRDGNSVYGYLMHGPVRTGRMVTVKQAYIDMDVRRVGFGRIAAQELVVKVVQGWGAGIRLRCADDLASNWFWQALGFRRTATKENAFRGWKHVEGAGQRKRLLHEYEFNVAATFLAPSDLHKLWTPDGTILETPKEVTG